MSEQVKIIVPACSTDAISEGLRLLTRVCGEHGHAQSGGFLGGEDGYGAHYESAVFLMRPFCWCQRADCPWCLDCECECRWDTPENQYREGAKLVLISECGNCRGQHIDTTPQGGTAEEPKARGAGPQAATGIRVCATRLAQVGSRGNRPASSGRAGRRRMKNPRATRAGA